METREERIYRQNKDAITLSVANMEKRVKQSATIADSLIVEAGAQADLLTAVNSNGWLTLRARLRNRLWSTIPTHHTLEVCLGVSNSLLTEGLQMPDASEGKFVITVLSSTLSTESPDFANSNSRVDQVLVTQLVKFVEPAGLSFEMKIEQPVFLKISQTEPRELKYDALTTPRVTSPSQEGALFVDTIKAALISRIFAGKMSGTVDFQLPKSLSDIGLAIKTSRAAHGVIRLYYGKNERTDAAVDAPMPAKPDALVVKMTLPLLQGMFLPQVSASIVTMGIHLESFSLRLDPPSQFIHAVIAVSQGWKQDFGKIKVTGKGNAKVRQSVAAVATNSRGLVFKAVGATTLDGDPWPSDVHAHIDTLGVGGGIGTNVPDKAVDAIYDFAKGLGLRLSADIPPQTFAEEIPLSPFRLLSSTIRSTDLVLQLVS